MTIGDRYDQPDWDPEELDEEWQCITKMGIEETRMLYNAICGYLEIWPGYPRRPTEEQQYLQYVKTKLFAMITDYNFTHMS